MPAVTDRFDHPDPTRFLWLVALAGVVVVFQFAANGWVAYRHGLHEKNVLRVLVAAPIIVLTLRIGFNAERPLKEILFAQPLNLALIALAALSLLLRRQLRRWLDRRFFREEYRQEQVLLELIEKIKTITSLPELTETVHQQIRDALHPQAIHFYYRERELMYTGTSRLRRLYLALSPDAQLLRLLDGTTEPQDFPTAALAGLPPAECQWLENRLGQTALARSSRRRQFDHAGDGARHLVITQISSPG